MRPVTFEGYDAAVGRGQKEYLPLPCHLRDGIATSCWQLDDVELAEIARTRRVWVQVMKGASPHQPIKLFAESPDFGINPLPEPK